MLSTYIQLLYKLTQFVRRINEKFKKMPSRPLRSRKKAFFTRHTVFLKHGKNCTSLQCCLGYSLWKTTLLNNFQSRSKGSPYYSHNRNLCKARKNGSMRAAMRVKVFDDRDEPYPVDKEFLRFWLATLVVEVGIE